MSTSAANKSKLSTLLSKSDAEKKKGATAATEPTLPNIGVEQTDELLKIIGTCLYYEQAINDIETRVDHLKKVQNEQSKLVIKRNIFQSALSVFMNTIKQSKTQPDKQQARYLFQCILACKKLLDSIVDEIRNNADELPVNVVATIENLELTKKQHQSALKSQTNRFFQILNKSPKNNR